MVMKPGIHMLVLATLLSGGLAWSVTAEAQRRLPTPKSSQFARKWDGKRFSHRLYDSLLRRHVKRGHVDYAGIRRHSTTLLNEYHFRLAHTNPAKLNGGKAARLAFWINAHNALALQVGLRRQGRRAKARTARPRGKSQSYAIQVGGRWYTLAQIRDRIIRARFKEPRALFALMGNVLAVAGLRSRAYRARRLGRQLSRLVRRYLARPKPGVTVDRKQKLVWLPQGLSAYQKDFSGSLYKSLLAFVAAHLRNGADAAYIKANSGKLTPRFGSPPRPLPARSR